MSKENYEACSSYKKLVLMPGLDHGLCYPGDKEGYYRGLREFMEEINFKY